MQIVWEGKGCGGGVLGRGGEWRVLLVGLRIVWAGKGFLVPATTSSDTWHLHLDNSAST